MYSLNARCVRLHKHCYWLNLVDWDQKVAKPWLTVGLSFYRPTAQQIHWGSQPVLNILHHRLWLFHQPNREVHLSRCHHQVRMHDQFALLMHFSVVISTIYFPYLTRLGRCTSRVHEHSTGVLHAISCRLLLHWCDLRSLLHLGHSCTFVIPGYYATMYPNHWTSNLIVSWQWGPLDPTIAHCVPIMGPLGLLL